MEMSSFTFRLIQQVVFGDVDTLTLMRLNEWLNCPLPPEMFDKEDAAPIHNGDIDNARLLIDIISECNSEDELRTAYKAACIQE